MRGNQIGLAIGLLLFVGLAAAPVASAADSCDNATLREQNGSTELPDCRAYEMVTPPYKQGFPVIPQAFSDNGIVSYSSGGAFADIGYAPILSSPYLGVRSPAGWEAQALYPPRYTPSWPTVLQAGDMRSSVVALVPNDQPGSGGGLYVRDLKGGLTRVGQGSVSVEGDVVNLTLLFASDDLSHMVVGDTARMWEYVGVGGAAVARRVTVDNHGQWLPSDNSCPNGISRDGRVIVFGSGCGGSALWARVGGSATVAVSRSECTRGPTDLGGVCNGPSPATYVGGTSRVFFTTAQQLVNTDRDLTGDLYACDIPEGVPAPVGDANRCAELTEISGTTEGADVGSVVALSEDGSRLAFIARGVLAGNPGVDGGVAVAGAQNLYRWTRDAAHPAGQMRFVAKVDGGISGVRTAGDGRYLVFSSGAALVSSGPGADEDGGAADVYRYDAESETVVRLSTSVTGSGGNGSFDVTVPSVSADGSMVVFGTAEALSPNDTDGVSDVYLWREGSVSRISRGGGRAMGISATGQDIYFVTKQQLVAADGDVNTDIYDARVGGGFAPTRSESCSGDACQGQRSGAPDLAGPSAGGLEDDDGTGEVTPVVSLRSVSAAQRKRLAATGKLNLAVSANTAGVLRMKATAKIAGKMSTVASGRRTIARPGTATVALTLSKKARKQLAARGRLAVRIVVSHSKAARGGSVTLRLAHAKAKGGRS